MHYGDAVDALLPEHGLYIFCSYFRILSGGAESGFRHVKPTEYKPRLLHFSGTRKAVEVREVPMSVKRLVSSDVFILDLGLKVYQWNGSEANKDEKFKVCAYFSVKYKRNELFFVILFQ